MKIVKIAILSFVFLILPSISHAYTYTRNTAGSNINNPVNVTVDCFGNDCELYFEGTPANGYLPTYQTGCLGIGNHTLDVTLPDGEYATVYVETSGASCNNTIGATFSDSFTVTTISVSGFSTTTIFRDTVQSDFDNMTGFKFDALIYIPMQMFMTGIGLFLLLLNLSWPYLVGFIAIVGTIYCLYQIGRRHI